MKAIFVERRLKITSKNNTRIRIGRGFKFLSVYKRLTIEKNPKGNVTTLVTVYSEVTGYNESYIVVKLNKNDIQKSHWIQNPVMLADARIRGTSNRQMLPCY